MANTTQDFVPIKEIRDGVVILRDGSMRAVLLVTSINFELKSAEEKTAILFQYQNFLNSLDFSIQLYIQSRKLNINPYLQLLENASKEQTNELLKIQISEYMTFIADLTSRVNIMTKSFFAVVPYSPPAFNSKKGFLSQILPGKKTTSETAEINEENFQEYKTQLEQRTSIVSQGLNGVGLRSSILGTEELIELYFKIFNPDEVGTPTVNNPK